MSESASPWTVTHLFFSSGGLGFTNLSEEIAFLICHHISLGMQSTSPSYSFSYKQPWTVNPNNSLSNGDTEASNRKMCVDSTSQQQKRYQKQTLDQIHCLYADTQYLIQWLTLSSMWLSFSIYFWSSNLEILCHLSFITWKLHLIYLHKHIGIE